MPTCGPLLILYSKFTARDKTEVDDFIQSMEPYDIIRGEFGDDIWASPPTRPWQKGLDNAESLDPLLATSHNPEASQYYTRIPRHGRPRRLDAILVRQRIPNIPWTYYNVIRMPISDHSLVLIGLRWCTGGHTTIGPKPQPDVKRWYASHFKKFKTNMANLAPPRDSPLGESQDSPHGTTHMHYHYRIFQRFLGFSGPSGQVRRSIQNVRHQH